MEFDTLIEHIKFMQNSIGNKLSEINTFFSHNDLSLARRRLLDVIYDINDHVLLAESVEWSKRFENVNDKTHWIKEGMDLCDRIQSEDLGNIPNSPLIDAPSISKKYNHGFFSLKNIPLTLKAGEIIGVVGENGNGKTTLLRSVAGFLSTGLNRENYSYVSAKKPFYYSLKQSTGFIPQRIPKWYGKLVDNLRFSAAINGIKGAENELMVAFILERFGLTKFANHTWAQISSGYRTRFEVARVVLQRPAVLILDEPLANLDINAQQTLLQDLRYIAQSYLHPMGIILTSQQLFEVEKIADKVLYIKDGSGHFNRKDDENQYRVFEIETTGSREAIMDVLGDAVSEIRFNGGVYEIYTSSEPSECIEKLVKNNLKLQYYRDISSSSKRFF